MLCSGLPRTLETASIVAPGTEPESWPELREIQGGRLSEIPADALQREFVHAFRGVIPNETRFLRGESIGELFDRVLPARRAPRRRRRLGHRARRPPRRRQPRDPLVRAHRREDVPRPLRAGTRLRERARPRRRWRVDRARGERRAVRPPPRLASLHDDGALLGAVPRPERSRGRRPGPYHQSHAGERALSRAWATLDEPADGHPDAVSR